MDVAQEVKSRLNIEDVIAQYVQLKRMGRNYKGLSPWTNEKTPSFVVSPEKQIWHDFSSGKGGDVISFIMEVEGLDFRTALESLARQAGVDLGEFSGIASTRNSKIKGRVLEALELSAKFYQKQLTASKPALEYLIKQRGFYKQTVLDWRFGYAPNTGHAVVDFLKKRGFTTTEIKQSGLGSQRGGAEADMFRGRIMIPLCDSRGTVVGFTARLLINNPQAPKYINTPQTIVYDKSRNVFGLHHAKESIRKLGYVVVAEGNLDVIQSSQAGVKNVVASAGTAMTTQQLSELKRFTGDIRLSFDADRAGVDAAERMIPLAQKVGVNLRIIALKDAKDPDELIRKNPSRWQQCIDEAKEAVDWLIERYSAELDLGTAAGKREFGDILVPTIRSLHDPIEKEHYLQRIAELTGTTLEAVQTKFISTNEEQPAQRLKKPKLSTQNNDKTRAEYQKLQDHFLAMVMMQPSLRDLLDNLLPDIFTDGPSRQVFKFLKDNQDFKGDAKSVAGLKESYDYVKIISLQFEELYSELNREELSEQARSLRHRLVVRYVKMQNMKLTAAMQNAKDEAELSKLMKQADKLNHLINPAND